MAGEGPGSLTVALDPLPAFSQSALSLEHLPLILEPRAIMALVLNTLQRQ